MLVNGTNPLLDLKGEFCRVWTRILLFCCLRMKKRKKYHIFYLISRIFQDYIEYIFLEGLVDKYGLIED